jgi:hypothetical protein
MNYVPDQLAVQLLLNAIPVAFGGTGGALKIKPVLGMCPDALYNAIVHFQQVNVGTITPDGIVESGGATLFLLNRLADQHFPVTSAAAAVSARDIDRFVGTKIQAFQDRWKEHPEELQRVQQRQTQAALQKWHAWAERLRREGPGNANVKAAVVFLDDIARRTPRGSEPSFNGWAVGFGLAYVASGFGSDWQLKVMLEEVLAYHYEKRNVRVTNLGLDSAPVILFSNQTHILLKKHEQVVVDEP